MLLAVSGLARARVAALARQKSTTGIVGLAVEPEARSVLSAVYTRTLEQLQAFPAESAYRSTVEALTKERLAVVESKTDLLEIEEQIGAGQVEQLIQQANDELSLMPALLDAKVWEEYVGPPAEEIYADLKRRGITLQRHDIPMQPSQDYPTSDRVELIAPAPPVDS
jgi:NADH dehydrogenase (ubiquinone) 1 alpha subcomplex subunit 5